MLTLQTYSDGGARGNPGPSACGVVLCDEKGTVIQEASASLGHRTNNQAEYEGMLLALELARQKNARRLHCFSDSELMVYQIQGSYKIKNDALKTLAEKVKSLASQFESITFQQVPRSHPMIARADKLLNQTLDKLEKSDRPTRQAGPDEPRQKELF